MSTFGGEIVKHKVSTATPVFTDQDLVTPSIETTTAGARVYLAGGSTGTLSTPLRVDPTGTTDQPVRVKDGSGNSIGSVAGALNVSGTFAAVASSTSTSPAQTAVSNSASIILAANASRKRFTVQNTGITPIYIALGGSSPTSTAYTLALPAAGFADDGSSALYSDTLWTGAVRAICAVSGTCVITEMT